MEKGWRRNLISMGNWKCCKCGEKEECMKYDIETPNYHFYVCVDCMIEMEDDIKELLTSKFGYEFA